MPIVWNDNLKTGIDVIDYQHQRLFETINKLDKVKTIKITFYEVLLELRVYISEHFRVEEKFMSTSKYPDYETHRDHHDIFIEKYKEFFHIIMKSSNVMEHSDKMISFVETWIEQHYSNEDVKMANYLRNYFQMVFKLKS